MKYVMVLMCLVSSLPLMAIDDYEVLKKEDQQYFKNESFEGRNRLERIDLNVKEINKLHGEIAAMKSDIANLKQEIELLKAKK